MLTKLQKYCLMPILRANSSNDNVMDIYSKIICDEQLNDKDVFILINLLKKAAEIRQKTLLEEITFPHGEHKVAVMNYRIERLEVIYSLLQYFYTGKEN